MKIISEAHQKQKFSDFVNIFSIRLSASLSSKHWYPSPLRNVLEKTELRQYKSFTDREYAASSRNRNLGFLGLVEDHKQGF